MWLMKKWWWKWVRGSVARVRGCDHIFGDAFMMPDAAPLAPASAFWLRTYYLSQLCMLCDASERSVHWCSYWHWCLLLPALETLWLWPKLPLCDCFISLSLAHQQPSTSPYGVGVLSAGGTKSTRANDLLSMAVYHTCTCHKEYLLVIWMKTIIFRAWNTEMKQKHRSKTT